MTELIAAGFAFAALIVVLACTFADRKRLTSGPDVGMALVSDVDEDINAPSLDVIDAALTLTTDPGGRDYLLDMRIDAMRRAE